MSDCDFYRSKFEGILKSFPNINKKDFMNDAKGIVYDELGDDDEHNEKIIWKNEYKPIAEEVWKEHK